MADNYTVKDGAGANVTFKSKDNAGVQTVQSIPSDSTGTPFGSSNPLPIAGSAVRSTTTATITSGTSVSGTVDLTSTSLLGFIAPAAWTTAALNIEVSTDNSTWVTAGILDGFGSNVSRWSAVTAGAAYSIDVVNMLPYRYIRFRSGTSASPVNQGADRVFTVITRPLA